MPWSLGVEGGAGDLVSKVTSRVLSTLYMELPQLYPYL